MYEIEKSFDTRILSLQKERPTVVVTEPLDPRVLEALCYLPRFIKPVLLAREEDVRAVATQHLTHMDPTRLDFALSESVCVDIAKRGDLVEEFQVFGGVDEVNS